MLNVLVLAILNPPSSPPLRLCVSAVNSFAGIRERRRTNANLRAFLASRIRAYPQIRPPLRPLWLGGESAPLVAAQA